MDVSGAADESKLGLLNQSMRLGGSDSAHKQSFLGIGK